LVEPKGLDETPTQHRVIRQMTERLGRLLASELKAVHGREVPVYFAYQGEGGFKKPHVTLIQYWVDRVTDRMQDRRQERAPNGDEYFRMAPLLLIARYVVTAWAPAPEDQELLALAIRILYDSPILTADGEGEEDCIHYEDKPGVELMGKFTLEEARTICEAYGMPLRPCARYDIPFRLDSERKTPIKRVKERIIDYKKVDG
jgi:hypothetical protein